MAAQGQNPKIIVSYRRSDSAMAGRIFDRLAQHFGKTSLFTDIDNVPFGIDFRKHIDDALKSSDLMIAVVGEKWLGPQAGGKLRIVNEADPVRVELETALKRDITVLPVLLDGTSMPDPADPRLRLSQCHRGRVRARLQHAYRSAGPRHRADPRRQGQGAGRPSLAPDGSGSRSASGWPASSSLPDWERRAGIGWRGLLKRSSVRADARYRRRFAPTSCA